MHILKYDTLSYSSSIRVALITIEVGIDCASTKPSTFIFLPASIPITFFKVPSFIFPLSSNTQTVNELEIIFFLSSQHASQGVGQLSPEILSQVLIVRSPNTNIARSLVNGSSIPHIAPSIISFSPVLFFFRASITEIAFPVEILDKKLGGRSAFFERFASNEALEF